MALVIAKVGGSLFDLPDLGSRLAAQLMAYRDDTVVLFPGGGSTADVVRDWHARFALDEEPAHQLAIRALTLNAELLKYLLPDARLICSRAECDESSTAGRVLILVPAAELTRLEDCCPETAPPHLWDVTSDSLSAWIAIQWLAERLVLLKSAAHPLELSVLEATRCGLVDPYFAGLAGEIPVIDWCPLRDSEPRSSVWLKFGANSFTRLPTVD